MNPRTMLLALVALAFPLMGATKCDPNNVPLGAEVSTIDQAWDYEPANLTEQVQRLELVVQLQQREYDRILHAERDWIYECFAQMADPVPPSWYQFPNFEGFWVYCENTYGPNKLDYNPQP